MQRTTGVPSGSALTQRSLFLLFLLSVVLAGVVTLLVATRWGLGVTPDSVGYLKAARNFLQGRSMSEIANRPVTQWPPLYPMTLTISGLFGINLLAGARFLHVLLYAANVLLVGHLLYKYGRLFWIAAVGAVLLAGSSVMLRVHAYAWSEPLFILLALLALVFLERYLDNGRRLNLVTAALLVGVACLTRYVGVALIGTAVLGLLFFQRSSLREKVLSMVIFSFLSAMPLTLWFVRNLFATGSTTGRIITFHPVGQDHLWNALYTFSSWLQIAEVTPGVVWFSTWFIIIAVAIFTLWLRRHEQRSAGSEPETIPYGVKLQALFIVTYGMFLIISISFLDANTPLDDRILSPVFVSGLILMLFLAGEANRLVGQRHKVVVSSLLGVPLILLTAAHLMDSASWVAMGRAQGLGYSSRRWQESPMLATVETLPTNIDIFSNAPEAIELLAGRPATPLPRRVEAMTAAENAGYEEEVVEMKEIVESGEGVIVFFNVLDRPVMTIEELHQRLSLRPLVRVEDGAIYSGHNRK